MRSPERPLSDASPGCAICPDMSCNHGFPAGTFRAAGCQPLLPGTVRAFGDSHPVPERVDCTRRCRMSPAERAFCHTTSLRRASRPVRAGRERADRVHIGHKGSERTHTDERKPHDSAVHIDGQGVPTALCHRFGHSGPRSPPVALSVRAAELDEEYPGHDERNAGHHGAGQRFTEEEP